jgi:hypothetical protein
LPTNFFLKPSGFLPPNDGLPAKRGLSPEAKPGFDAKEAKRGALLPSNEGRSPPSAGAGLLSSRLKRGVPA